MGVFVRVLVEVLVRVARRGEMREVVWKWERKRRQERGTTWGLIS